MKNINKEAALKRLASIEEETRELKRIINTKSDWRSVVDFDSACEYLGKDANDLLDKWKYADLTLQQVNGLMLETCIQALNTEDGKRWQPNWDNQSEYKYYSWFEKTSSGWVGRSYSGYSVGSGVGSGSYYQTREKADHGAKHFLQYYSIWLG